MTSKQLQRLTIDDSLADALVLRSCLNQAFPAGFDLTHVTNAESGLEALRENPFDCVFLDYLLGDDDGLDVLRRIRASGDDVPIIAFSGNGCEDVAVEALKRGAQDYMVKSGLTSEAIERALSNAIEKVALARELKEKRQELEDFAHVAAHDLRGPLTTIRGMVSLLIDGIGGQCDRDATELLKRVEASSFRMFRLLDALMEYAESGRSQKQLVAVNLSTVLSAVLENLFARIESSDARVRHANLPEVLGDDVALTQLLQNLIANAIKFCRESPPIVTIGAQKEGGNWVISVADNGIGIAPEHLDRIFAPFKRLHTQSEFEGSGIGLATCRKIVDQHDGELRVESKLGRGTTFFVTLRAASASHTNLTIGRPHIRGTQPSANAEL